MKNTNKNWTGQAYAKLDAMDCETLRELLAMAGEVYAVRHGLHGIAAVMDHQRKSVWIEVVDEATAADMLARNAQVSP